MIKSYWCTLENAVSVADTVAAINSEQTDFLNSLGITIAATDTNNILITKSGAFTVSVTRTNGIVTANSSSTVLVTTATTTSAYCNLMFTANSLLITKNSNSTVPNIPMVTWTCITKNSDDTVSIISPDANGNLRLLDRYDFTSFSDVPYITISLSSTGVNQFSLAAIPRTEIGKQFENAFAALATNVIVYSGIGSIGDNYFAFSKMSGYTFACK